MQSKLIWPMVIITTAILAGIFSWINSSSPIRSIISFLFMLVIPGLAFTRLFNLKDFLTEIVVAIALSLVISTILAEFMVFTHLWSPLWGLSFLVGISIVGAILQITRHNHNIPQEGS